MRLRILAAALALPLALSGALTACGGDPAAPPPLTPATSTASSPTPTEQAETAEEFIRRFESTADEMQTTGVSTDYRAMTANCESCDGLADQVDGIYAAGGYIHYEGTQVRSVIPRGHQTFDVRVTGSRTKYLEREGGAIKTLDGGRLTYRFYLQRVASGWRVHDITQLAGGSS